MARHQSKAQQDTVGRVMHEFKHGELGMRSVFWRADCSTR